MRRRRCRTTALRKTSVICRYVTGNLLFKLLRTRERERGEKVRAEIDEEKKENIQLRPVKVDSYP